MEYQDNNNPEDFIKIPVFKESKIQSNLKRGSIAQSQGEQSPIKEIRKQTYSVPVVKPKLISHFEKFLEIGKDEQNEELQQENQLQQNQCNQQKQKTGVIFKEAYKPNFNETLTKGNNKLSHDDKLSNNQPQTQSSRNRAVVDTEQDQKFKELEIKYARQHRIMNNLNKKLRIQHISREQKFNEALKMFKDIDTFVDVRPFLQDMNLVNNEHMYKMLHRLKEKIELKRRRQLLLQLFYPQKQRDDYMIYPEERDFQPKFDLLKKSNKLILKYRQDHAQKYNDLTNKQINFLKDSVFQSQNEIGDLETDTGIFFDLLKQQLFAPIHEKHKKNVSKTKKMEEDEELVDIILDKYLENDANDDDMMLLKQIQERANKKLLTIEDFNEAKEIDVASENYYQAYRDKSNRIQKTLRKITEQQFRKKWGNAQIKEKQTREMEKKKIIQNNNSAKHQEMQEIAFPSKKTQYMKHNQQYLQRVNKANTFGIPTRNLEQVTSNNNLNNHSNIISDISRKSSTSPNIFESPHPSSNERRKTDGEVSIKNVNQYKIKKQKKLNLITNANATNSQKTIQSGELMSDQNLTNKIQSQQDFFEVDEALNSAKKNFKPDLNELNKKIEQYEEIQQQIQYQSINTYLNPVQKQREEQSNNLQQEEKQLHDSDFREFKTPKINFRLSSPNFQFKCTGLGKENSKKKSLNPSPKNYYIEDERNELLDYINTESEQEDNGLKVMITEQNDLEIDEQISETKQYQQKSNNRYLPTIGNKQFVSKNSNNMLKSQGFLGNSTGQQFNKFGSKYMNSSKSNPSLITKKSFLKRKKPDEDELQKINMKKKFDRLLQGIDSFMNQEMDKDVKQKYSEFQQNAEFEKQKYNKPQIESIRNLHSNKVSSYL